MPFRVNRLGVAAGAALGPYRFLATLSLLLLTSGFSRAQEQQKQNDLDGCNIEFRFAECGDEEEELVVLGHKSPDTDAVSAAIIRAWELRTGPVPVCALPYVNTDAINRETEFVLDYFNIDVPPTISELVLNGSTEETKTFRKFAVVDTNNVEELPEDANDASETHLHSVVDHHRMTGTLTSDKPIVFDMRVLTSTGSIIYQRSLVEDRPIPGANCPVNIAGLMLATILSDSLVFRSSTTTQADKDNAKALAPLAGIDDYETFGEQMLAAKSDITGMTAEELVIIDSKQVEADKSDGDQVIIRISVFETVLSDQVLDMAEEMAAACDLQLLKDQTKDDNAVAVLFFIINILDNEAIYIPCSNQYGTDLVLNGQFQMANQTDGQLLDPPEYVSPVELSGRNGTQVIVLPTVLSRKKQIMPALLGSVEVTPYTGNMAEEVDCMEFVNGTIKCHGQVITEGTNADEVIGKVTDTVNTVAEASEIILNMVLNPSPTPGP